MGYCVNILRNNPDSAVLAVAAASLLGAGDLAYQQIHLGGMVVLLRDFRATSQIETLADLKQEHIWLTWAAGRQEKKDWGRHALSCYNAIANTHFPAYLCRLSDTDQQRMSQYAPPSPPRDLSQNYFPFRKILSAQQAARKEVTDILVPLYPVLRQLVRLRKELAERVLRTIRSACQKVEAGEAVLPYHFQHTDTIPEVKREARTIAEAEIQGREVAMKFILWDRRTWVKHHTEHYSHGSKKEARSGRGAYAEVQNCFFVEFNGPVSDCLWFGDLVERRVLQKFKKWTHDTPEPEDYQSRWKYARQLGFSAGCACKPRGLLDSGNRWFSLAADRADALIFEPESLYRGVLFGSALAMIALSNGSRMSELLQVSWNKERRVTRTERVVLLDMDGQPQMGSDGQPLTKEVKLHFQHLLPKGAKTEEERQLFPLSKEAMRYLGEIKMLLEKAHGEIPIVPPARDHGKRTDLSPERYLFQWNVGPDGQENALSSGDAQILLRFMFHGLDFYTAKGKPIRVSVHVLRHVMATHARRYRDVPPEVVAHFFLHHRLQQLTERVPSLSEVSEYYTLLTEDQRFSVISADLSEQEELDHALLQIAPTIRDLEQKNVDLEAVYEIWHALHPTALGNCACPGLCPRENDRSLCLGCSYHVEDPEKLGAALTWRADYAKQAALFEAQGSAIDARQARIKVQYLDDMINVMRMQLEEEAAGRYIPVFKVLPSSYRTQEEHHDAED